MICKKITYLIHGHLDGDLTGEEEHQLRTHLQDCPNCMQHLRELKKSMALVQSLSHTRAPEDFTEKVMAALPPKKRRIDWKKQLINHPFLVAASLFVILMAGSLMSAWSDGRNQFQVSAPHQQKLIIDESHHTVIVPKGQFINGDIEVRNGTIRVDGEVKGNVVAIDGEVVQASTARISGDVEVINRAFEWVWYNTKKVVSNLVKG